MARALSSYSAYSGEHADDSRYSSLHGYSHIFQNCPLARKSEHGYYMSISIVTVEFMKNCSGAARGLIDLWLVLKSNIFRALHTYNTRTHQTAETWKSSWQPPPFKNRLGHLDFIVYTTVCIDTAGVSVHVHGVCGDGFCASTIHIIVVGNIF